MNRENILRGLFTAAVAALGAYFHQLMVPCVLLAVAMALDYFTGMANAWMHHALSSKAGAIGVVKKLCYGVAVAVAVVVDLVIRSAAEQAGVDADLPHVFALLVTVWLVMNECISILENIAEIGVPVPEFLLKIIRRLKQGAETAGGQANGDG